MTAANTPAPKAAKTPARSPMTVDEALEAITDIVTEWGIQNQETAKADVFLGSFRTTIQPSRLPVVD